MTDLELAILQAKARAFDLLAQNPAHSHLATAALERQADLAVTKDAMAEILRREKTVPHD